MTTTEIIQKIEAARKRGDGIAVANFRADLPFEERQRIFGQWTIAAGRGNAMPPIRLVGTSGNPPPVRSQTGPSLFMRPSLLRALREAAEFDGRESGGFLIGASDSDGIEILGFRKAMNEDSNTWRSVELDLQRGLSILRDLPLDRTIVGEYHNHPTGCGTTASKQDIQAAAGLAQSFQRDRWVSLITCDPDDPRAIRGEVSAYVVRPDGNYDITQITERRLETCPKTLTPS